jgi:hypothetical protein
MLGASWVLLSATASMYVHGRKHAGSTHHNL